MEAKTDTEISYQLFRLLDSLVQCFHIFDNRTFISMRDVEDI